MEVMLPSSLSCCETETKNEAEAATRALLRRLQVIHRAQNPGPKALFMCQLCAPTLAPLQNMGVPGVVPGGSPSGAAPAGTAQAGGHTTSWKGCKQMLS